MAEGLRPVMPRLDLGAERTVMLCLCVLVTSLTLLFSQGAITDGSDGRSMYEVTKSAVERGSLAIGDRYGFPGRDGKYYASHGLGLPLLAMLPYVAARPLARLTTFEDAAIEAVVASLIPFITGLLVAALYSLARRLGAEAPIAVIVALGAAFGTYLLAFSKEFFSEPLAALCIVVAVERAVAKRAMACSVAASAAALTKQQYFALLPILVWRLWRDNGWRVATIAGIPLAAGLVLALAYNVARFGDPTHFGYAGLGFTTPFLRGARGLLFHPDKSIFFFAPIVIVIPFALHHVWAVNRTAFWLLTGNLALTFVTLANWVDWYGGWVWGPRPLIPGVIPAIAAVAVWVGRRRFRRFLVVSLFVIGFFVSAPTLVVSQRAQLIHDPPAFGPNILRQIRLVPETFRSTLEQPSAHTSEESRYERYVNTWQFSLIRGGGWRGVWLAASLSCALVVIAGLSARVLQATVRAMTREHG